jgi:hypothetical protein
LIYISRPIAGTTDVETFWKEFIDLVRWAARQFCLATLGTPIGTATSWFNDDYHGGVGSHPLGGARRNITARAVKPLLAAAWRIRDQQGVPGDIRRASRPSICIAASASNPKSVSRRCGSVGVRLHFKEGSVQVVDAKRLWYSCFRVCL